MKILKFPKGYKDDSVRIAREPSRKMSLGKVSFTCTDCSHNMSADFKGMLFRTIEMYCETCGTYFKVTNPGFSTPAPASKTKR